eukprot:350551-Chlamydomonas_euryale.AAC.2
MLLHSNLQLGKQDSVLKGLQKRFSEWPGRMYVSTEEHAPECIDSLEYSWTHALIRPPLPLLRTPEGPCHGSLWQRLGDAVSAAAARGRGRRAAEHPQLGCQCMSGQLINESGADGLRVYCQPYPQPGENLVAVWIVIALVLFLLLSVLWWVLLFRSKRPRLVQNMIDARKRLRGPPSSGVVTVVVTDIEGFSGGCRTSVERLRG